MPPVNTLRAAHRHRRPAALEAQAMDDLRYIRRAMENAASFTAVPGWGQVAVGVTALVAAGVAARQSSPAAWLGVWMVEAVIALAIGVWTMVIKSRRARVALTSGAGRRFIASFSLPMAAGAVLTAALFRAGLPELLPGTWLLLYGTAFAIGGAFSVRSIPLMGACFMVLGVAALFGPASWSAPFMAAGYGGLHIVFGFIVARRHGG
jgi:hypothetical protein